MFINSLIYIINAPYFWGSMGFTVGMAMFIGAYIYDGNMEQVKRGTAALGSYVSMLLWFTSIRVYHSTHGLTVFNGNKPELALASIVTILVLTVAWLSGMLIGVYLIHRLHKEL